MSPIIRRIVALAALATAVLAAPAGAQNYPRLGLYGSISGNGQPYLTTTGSLDLTTIDAVSRYHEVIIDASPISEYHHEIAQALRQRNPNIKLLAYVLGHQIWQVMNSDSLVHYPTRYYRLVRDLNGFLYNKGGTWFSIANVNLAKRDSTGRFVVAEGIADLWKSSIFDSGMWDGIFIDVYCADLQWAQSQFDSIDVVRAGYPDWPSFAAAWSAATDTLANRLRREVGPGYILVGNCVPGHHTAVFNGWMFENFPLQNGGTWWDNMLKPYGGYFSDDSLYCAPQQNYLFSAVAGPYNYDTNNCRKVRFGLGSAALGKGFGVFGPSSRIWTDAPSYQQWWYDEYAVDRSTGAASTLLQDVGWLGAPRSSAGQMIWVGTYPDASVNPGFDVNTLGWTLYSGFGAVGALSRDTTTKAVGTASGRVAITTPGTVDWYVSLTTTGTIAVANGSTYSATFWARASTPRSIIVAAAKTTSGAWDARTVQIGTTWQRYQVTLIPNGTGTATLQFQVARDAGSIWFDDVHFQLGLTSIWRRDFDNGIVLVNPGLLPLTVPLGGTFRTIAGVHDPLVNTGQTGTTFTVNGNDALFLLRSASRPAPVHDLHVSP